jgi:hypothetical protein
LPIAIEWQEFRTLDWESAHDTMGRPLILNRRNLLSPREMSARGSNIIVSVDRTEDADRFASD